MSESTQTIADDLPLTEGQAAIERCIEMLSGRIKHCGRSAFSHLRRAWTLYSVDKEMSLFRTITAEEEAATALILALRHRRYPGAERLGFRRHDHKAGVTPVRKKITLAPCQPVHLHGNVEARNGVGLAFPTHLVALGAFTDSLMLFSRRRGVCGRGDNELQVARAETGLEKPSVRLRTDPLSGVHAADR